MSEIRRRFQVRHFVRNLTAALHVVGSPHIVGAALSNDRIVHRSPVADQKLAASEMASRIANAGHTRTLFGRLL